MQVRLWAENLLFAQFLCNDAATFTRKRHLKNFLDDPCVLIRNELVAVIGVTVITIRRVRARVFPTQCLCLERRLDLAADVLGIPFIDDIFERCKFVISGSGIHAIRDGNEPHLILREDYFRVAPDFQIVAAKARQVFYNNRSHPPLLDQFHHFSKCRAVKVCAGVAIIHKELAIRKTVFLGILPQNGALGLDAHAFAADFIIAAQSAI